MKRVYLDHNATTPTHPDVVRAMQPYYEEIFGNASSVHRFGREARKAVEEARKNLASLLGAKRADEIIFTSGGTESDNFAIKGVARALRDKGNHIITSSVEHLAVHNTCKFLEKNGYSVTYIPVDKYGIIDLEAFKKSITDETILVTIMYANNETGTVEPLAEITKIAKERGVYLHTDAVQAVGKIDVNVEELGVDLLSLSGHKFCGPKGVGALYVRRGTKIAPMQIGGHHERNRRAGTENVPAIVGIGKAAELAGKNMAREAARIRDLRDRLQEGIEKSIKEVRLNGHPARRLPNTCNISFEYLEGESIILNLDMEGVAVSTGSACTSGSLEPSHVLISMGVSPQTAQGSIRFSLGRVNTKEDIDYLLKILPPIIERLRKMSPLYKE
ncbi:MAG: cysteine desulfurase NifS [Candidatus Omnitrophica bacterium]|nr:cysteine desulfurase NifS [Candidatus Omnitrophota bacterium]